MPIVHLRLRSVLLALLCLPGVALIPQIAIAAHATNHVVVKFRSTVRGQLRAVSRPAQLQELHTALGLPTGTELVEPPLHRLLPPRAAVRRPGELDLAQFFYLQLPPGLAAEDAVRRLANHPWVDYAELDGMGTGGAIPDDPNFSGQWHHQNAVTPSASIHTPLAWDIAVGSTNIIVAVLDSGLTVTEELSGRVLPGFNFVSSTTDTTDDHGHGSAVTGTLAASGNNGIQVAGVDWRCRVLPMKVLDASNNGLYSWWSQAIDLAVERGARVINLSAGGSGSSTALTTSILNAISRGVIFVTITHNDGTNVIRYPGNLSECITVGATDQADRRAIFSNFGPQMDLCAPGTNIATVGRSGSLERWWGTSFAAPLVSGVCGLLLSLRPELNQNSARALLCLGAEDQVGGSTDVAGFDNYHGWGRLNAQYTLVLATARLQATRGSNGTTELSWSSPPNSGTREPFRVEYRNSLDSGGSWTTATDPRGYRYTSDRTFWTDTNSAPSVRFYRLRLRTLP